MSEQTTHWHYGHNVAGYLPESDVIACEDWADAMSGLRSELDYEREFCEVPDEEPEQDVRAAHYGGLSEATAERADALYDDLTKAMATRADALYKDLTLAMDELDAHVAAGLPGDFLAYTDDGGQHTIPTAWWVRECSEDISECMADQED